MGTRIKIDAILLNIKINRPKLVNMCRYKLAPCWQNFTEIHLTWVKIVQKVLGGYFFDSHCISFTGRATGRQPRSTTTTTTNHPVGKLSKYWECLLNHHIHNHYYHHEQCQAGSVAVSTNRFHTVWSCARVSRRNRLWCLYMLQVGLDGAQPGRSRSSSWTPPPVLGRPCDRKPQDSWKWAFCHQSAIIWVNVT